MVNHFMVVHGHILTQGKELLDVFWHEGPGKHPIALKYTYIYTQYIFVKILLAVTEAIF